MPKHAPGFSRNFLRIDADKRYGQAERWPSGLRRRSRKPLFCEFRTVGSNPTLSAIFSEKASRLMVPLKSGRRRDKFEIDRDDGQASVA